MLHLWTDYIISDGRLEGPVYKADREGAKRSFSIPFNLDGGTLKGGFMLLQPLEYPFPLFPRLQLTRRPIAEVPKPKQEKSGVQPQPAENPRARIEPAADQARAIAEIEKLGGKVVVDKNGPGQARDWCEPAGGPGERPPPG